MLKNLHLKILSLFLAMFFWIFVVSLENTFFEMPDEIPIQVFNLAPELALSTKLPSVRLTLRASDPVALRRLSPADFEAYIDLRNIGAGDRLVPILVTSKNPQVSVVKSKPAEMMVIIEPVRQKLVTVVGEVKGQPAKGFRVDAIKLFHEIIAVKGAASLLAQISTAKALIALDGTEAENTTKKAIVKVYDASGTVLEELKIEEEVSALLTIVEVSNAKQVGVKAKITGAVVNGVVRRIEVSPAVISVKGTKEVLSQLEIVETEAIDVSSASASFEKKVRVVLPAGVSLEEGEKGEVVVKVEIEK
jgi:YbbR domain-containing protein